MEDNRLVLVASVVSVHGIDGRVKVKVFTEQIQDFVNYGGLTDGNCVYEIEIISVISKDTVIARAKGVESREAARRLCGKSLYIQRAHLPEITEEDQYYISDLIGLKVFRFNNDVCYGYIQAIENFGSCDILTVSLSEFPQKLEMFPFSKEVVRKVDLKEGIVVINVPEYIMAE